MHPTKSDTVSIAENAASIEETATDPADSFVRWVALLVILPGLFLAFWFITHIPRVVTSYRQLDHYASGKRVRFNCTYQGEVGIFRHVRFEDHPVLLKTREGVNESVPNVGETCWVVGNVKHFGGPIGGVAETVDFVISDAEFQRSH